MPPPAPARRHHRRRLTAALVAVCLLTVGLSWATKARCIGEPVWEAGEQYHQLCFTDAVILWFNRDLDVGAVPYVEADLEYPVVLGAQVWALSSFTHAVDGGVQAFLALNALVAAALAVAVLFLLRHLGAAPRRLWWWAAGPPLLLYAAWNWDLLAIVPLLASIALHRSGRHTAAGAVVGIGAAAKVFPALVVPAVVVGLARAGRWADAARFVGAAGGAWLAVNLPVAVAAPSGWWEFYAFSIERGATPASTWATLGSLPGLSNVADAATPLALPLLVVGVVAILVVGSRRLPPAESWRLVLPLVAWFLLVSKVYSPQFDLWLLPLLVLLLARIGPLLAFVAADLLIVWVEMLHLANRDGWSPALGRNWLTAAVLVRAAVLVWIVVVSLRPPARQRQVSSSRRASDASAGSSIPSHSGSR